jgi:hypothetical protein
VIARLALQLDLVLDRTNIVTIQRHDLRRHIDRTSSPSPAHHSAPNLSV